MASATTTSPTLLVATSIQDAWVHAIKTLKSFGWEARTLVVHITNPLEMDEAVHKQICGFAHSRGLRHPRRVARTIFPQRLYELFGSGLYEKYNAVGGLYERIPPRFRRWGTYFRRLTHFEGTTGPLNQLQNIVDKMNSSADVLRAAYTAVIPVPGSETVMRLGAPCLHYLAFQLVPTNPPTVGLLAVYRNHDFLERAYGNYWGLSNLLRFVAQETSQTAGWLTCVSSHAYVLMDRTALSGFVGTLP